MSFLLDVKEKFKAARAEVLFGHGSVGNVGYVLQSKEEADEAEPSNAHHIVEEFQENWLRFVIVGLKGRIRCCISPIGNILCLQRLILVHPRDNIQIRLYHLFQKVMFDAVLKLQEYF